MKKFVFIGLLIFIVLAVLHGIDTKNKGNIDMLREEASDAVTKKPVGSTPNGKGGNTILGASFTPANFPGSSLDDIRGFFTLADELGSTVILIGEWESGIDPKNIKIVRDMTHAQGMKFHYHISPISLDNGREDPAIPKSAGGKSFSDASVREAFKTYALSMAALKPDVLGLGTEVNFLAKNPKEFDQYVSLAKETYDAVKAQYPSETITISFQWDELRREDDPSKILALFKDSLDMYSFTTYPSFKFKDVDDMPKDYYSEIRTYLPTERIGFSEIGWNTKGGSNEDKQAEYYGKLPELLGGTKPEYALFGLLHDVHVFGGLLSSLNSVGLRNDDGTPKKSWDTVVNLHF